jgi:TatD DNase family protein
LDRWTEPFDKQGQEESFCAQLDIARKYDRPVTIHCVQSWGWLMDVLRGERELPNRLLIHSYGGSADLIKPLAVMGAYFSFSATVLKENFKRTRSAITAVPPERLLIETDAPCMLPPENYRVRRLIGSNGAEMNHPANLPTIADGIAELLGESHLEFRERLWHNSLKFWGDLI